MNAIEYTNNLIKTGLENHEESLFNVLVVGPEYNVTNKDVHFSVYDSDSIKIVVPEGDLAEWINKYRNSTEFKMFDLVILSRVYEHFEIRHIDWYTYQLSTIMTEGAKLICVVPNMPKVAQELEKCFDSDGNMLDEFKFKRLNYELLSEGPEIFWRHSFWSSKISTKYYLEQENLFKVQSVNEVVIDSNIVPPELEFIAIRN